MKAIGANADKIILVAERAKNACNTMILSPDEKIICSQHTTSVKIGQVSVVLL